MSLNLRLFAIGLSTFLSLSPFSALAQGLQCVSLFSSELWVHVGPWYIFDRYQNFNYETYQNILFLNDNGKGGSALANVKKDGQLVVSSDINYTYGGNLRADNNKLPFKENSFDLIVMNRGLCPCRGSVSCGGIDSKRGPMMAFLKQAIGSLDKTNPKSMAIFTGYYFPGLLSTLPNLWVSIVEELNPQYPDLQISILRDNAKTDNLAGFIGIAISVKSALSINEKLKTLNPELLP